MRWMRWVWISLLGFSSGLPLLATGSTLQAWMKDEGIDLTLIGAFALVGLPYTVKFLWAPFLDRYRIPFLGRRRGWALVAQLALAASLFALGKSDPRGSLMVLACFAFCVTFFSATQDIVLDAYRREQFRDEELGLASSLFVNGYRIGMLLAGAGALFMADRLPWTVVYALLAASLLIGVIAVLFCGEPETAELAPRTLRDAVFEPFKEYFQRDGAFLILAFILLYKIGDTMSAAMVTPFVLELGITKSELAAIAKTLGMAATIGGGFLGGLCMLRLGINRALWIFGIFQMVAILGFAILAQIGRSRLGLATVVTVDYLAIGMGTTAYTAYMASLCNKKFTATQYALFSSLMGIPRVLAAAPTGWIAKQLGWTWFFVFCTICAIPGLYLLKRITAPQLVGEPVRTE